MKIVCIIQARVGSTRLPKKILLKVQEKEILIHVLERVLRSKMIDEIIVATTTNPNDEQIVKLLHEHPHSKIKISRGSEEDVLDRYYQAAKDTGADIIVRITSDCPLIDWDLIDQIIVEFQKGEYDYISNVLDKRTYPRGLDVECFSFEVLDKMQKICKEKREREHVTTYIRENRAMFRTKNIEQDVDLSNLRWTLDEADDLKLITIIYNKLYQNKFDFNTEDIISLINKEPELAYINKHVEQKKNIHNEVN
ncbi:acylneuraminate cytidylyltransferase [Candidatus Pacearchaeota archaeon]|nr:acylneuraminate cytidylyltransferase [Candidatus Pacearchaeota archaeon]|tara:strand:- start:593 stop:1348 length:756 start_codon:yes stop_codon:yes gene_type:complete